MIRKPLFPLALALLLATGPLSARDVYVLRFSSPGPWLNVCSHVQWVDRLFFHNASTLPATVTLVETTYPIPAAAPHEVTVAAGHVVSVDDLTFQWDPQSLGAANPQTLGVAHFTVPNSVDVTSRTGSGAVICTGSCLCATEYIRQGNVPQRVYDELIPANTADVHVGTDLPGISSRTNVAVYNAGSESAVVTIELRETCNDSLLASQQLTIPPSSVSMASGMSAELQPCPNTRAFFDRGTYVRVVSSQPGLSWVTTLANDEMAPRATIIAN